MDQMDAEEPSPSSSADDLLHKRRLEANACIQNHVITAMGFGLIPSALLDVIAITGIEVKMIRDLAGLYDVPIPRQLLAYKLLLSLIGSVGIVYFSNKMQSTLKELPLIGHILYIGAFSLSGGAAIYAIGKIFQKHYESGEIFLNSDNKILRDYFLSKYREGKQTISSFVTSGQQPA